MRFLLDTNVLSEPTRPRPEAAVLRHLQRHADQVATASVVWHELAFGVARIPEGERRARLAAYLHDLQSSTLPVLAYDRQAAAWHGSERARLEAAGLSPAFVDGQIAAVASVHGLVVVTRTVSDFEPFDIEVVSWWP